MNIHWQLTIARLTLTVLTTAVSIVRVSQTSILITNRQPGLLSVLGHQVGPSKEYLSNIFSN